METLLNGANTPYVNQKSNDVFSLFFLCIFTFLYIFHTYTIYIFICLECLYKGRHAQHAIKSREDDKGVLPPSGVYVTVIYFDNLV